MDALRVPLRIAAGAAIAAGIALVLAAIAGPPYLGSDGINGWLVVFAAALFAALLAVPFAIERLLRGSYDDAEARWDRAVPAWGVVALFVIAVGALLGVAGSFAADSLAASTGLVMMVAGGLVLIAVLFMLLAG
jgi:hypothetical protein